MKVARRAVEIESAPTMILKMRLRLSFLQHQVTGNEGTQHVSFEFGFGTVPFYYRSLRDSQSTAEGQHCVRVR
jgi:hypothetical protein